MNHLEGASLAGKTSLRSVGLLPVGRALRTRHARPCGHLDDVSYIVSMADRDNALWLTVFTHPATGRWR